MEVDAGGRTIAGVTTILQNGSPFTYFQDRAIEIAEGATLESDALAGAVLHRATPLGLSFVGLRALSRRARVVRHRQVTGLPRVTELRVRTADGRPLPLQVDGDYLGEVPEARYSVLPEALNVVA
jgi:diacylglycerol kinase family enzyme